VKSWRRELYHGIHRAKSLRIQVIILQILNMYVRLWSEIHGPMTQIFPITPGWIFSCISDNSAHNLFCVLDALLTRHEMRNPIRSHQLNVDGLKILDLRSNFTVIQILSMRPVSTISSIDKRSTPFLGRS